VPFSTVLNRSISEVPLQLKINIFNGDFGLDSGRMVVSIDLRLARLSLKAAHRENPEMTHRMSL